MKVIAYDPYLSPERADDLGVEKVDLDALFARADFISLHAPATDATRGMINAASLAKMKRGVRIDQLRPRRPRRRGRPEAGAGQRPGRRARRSTSSPRSRRRTAPLFGMEQVVATPHLGASTTEAQEKVALQVAEQMADFLLTGAVVNALNMPSVSAEEMPKLTPYMGLARQIGSFMGQIVESAVTSVTHRVRRPRGAAQHQAADRAGPGRAAVAADGDGQHGQRAVDREGARHRRQPRSSTSARGAYRRMIRLTVTDRGAGAHHRRHAVQRRSAAHRRDHRDPHGRAARPATCSSSPTATGRA